MDDYETFIWAWDNVKKERGKMLPLSEQFNVWIKETKRNGGVLIGSSIREFFKWVEDRNSGVFSDNIV